MDSKENEKYKLYALLAGDAPSDAEFYFLLPEIDLVYTREAPPKAMEISDPQQIPAEAREWLANSIAIIAERYLRENTDVTLAGSRTFLDRLREELDAEIKKSTEEAIEHG